MSAEELNQLNAPGIAWVKDRSGGGKRLISTYYVKTEDARRITGAQATAREFDQAAHDVRDAGEDGHEEEIDGDLLARVAGVIGDRKGATWDELVAALDMAEADLQETLRVDYSIGSERFRVEGERVRGVTRETVEEVLAERD